MDLYETLGVRRDAPRDSIRRAFRRQAKSAHPDRGGDGDKMARLNEAYRVLTDETARAHYDATGETRVPDSYEQARNLLAELFKQAFLKKAPGNLVHQMKVGLSGELRKHSETIEECNREISAIRARAKKVKTHSERVLVLVESAVTQAVDEYRKKASASENSIQQIKKSLELLEDLSDDLEGWV